MPARRLSKHAGTSQSVGPLTRFLSRDLGAARGRTSLPSPPPQAHDDRLVHLRRHEDYAWVSPALYARKLRALEL
jgi:hypothetical protein